MRLAAASVCVKELPSGNQRSMMTSGRLDSGKNCSGTWARVATPTPNNATVPTMTTQIAEGDHVGTLTADWRKTGYGWVLKQSYFGEVE